MSIRGTRLVHDARFEGAHKVPFFQTPYVSARARVCLSVCLCTPMCSRNRGGYRVVTRCHLASRGAGKPRKHMGVLCRRVRSYLQRELVLVYNGRIGRFESMPVCVCVCARARYSISEGKKEKNVAKASEGNSDRLRSVLFQFVIVIV